ncbi:hypothetical protein HYT56_03475 [Candidatus Woesearchaeota archaeon]|nr:hypothetical protein [Candidatus Woesearchaeota archaeon]
MAKKRASRNSQSVSNPFDKLGLKNPISSERWETNTIFFGLLVIVTLIGLLSGNAYYSENSITGSVISDITGAQTTSGITPITNMLKDLFSVIFNSDDGIIATIFKNLFSTNNWLAAIAVLMVISGFFYLALKKTFFHGDDHNKLAVMIALGMGLLAIGITINDNTLVSYFKELFSSAILLIVLIVIGFVLWIFTLKAMTHTSKALGERHSASAERMGARKGFLKARFEKKTEKLSREKEEKLAETLRKLAEKHAKEFRSREALGDEAGKQAACNEYETRAKKLGFDKKDIEAAWQWAFNE